ncbi:hypothetical protein Pst134EA_005479 [Puccinia striiformis f. sp. tritici]|nr:hypothetical protein Pst134EA_005479 [Puccinia striiformis f. sp. tritici]KAH9462672.1 hypothetical protein Pst134EB_006555 [Puccinia striiformis f. sp. tritici]KAH9471587.1 hypothetical protein Pst134EA_005479 [Puccinia striiformis f. sp. tritici]
MLSIDDTTTSSDRLAFASSSSSPLVSGPLIKRGSDIQKFFLNTSVLGDLLLP